ncbi:MAG: alpha-ribazole phosphatase [Promethearchaeota archaeon]
MNKHKYAMKKASKSIEIYLVRHGKVKIKQGIIHGQSDVEPSNDYKKIVKKINKLGIITKNTAIYSSPLKRCHVLARALSRDEPIEDPRLMELNFGNWEMKKWNELAPQETNKWMEDFVKFTPPNGESYLELYDRVSDSFLELINKQPHEKVIIITHGGVIRSILTSVLKIPLKNSFSLEIDPGSITKILVNFDDKDTPWFKIKYINL